MFDERRIDPSFKELTTLLMKATTRANARLPKRRLQRSRSQWEHFIRRSYRPREGIKSFQGGYGGLPAANVFVVWWTDSIGRRHWRICGRRLAEPVRYDDPSWVGLFTQTALWYLYPDSVALRYVGTNSELVVRCGCGAVGTPEEIGWVGERCGPCHDRLEEGSPPLPRSPFTAKTCFDSGRLHQVVLTSNGSLVVTTSQGELIHWDASTGAQRTLLRKRGGSMFPLSVSSDGKIAVVCNKQLCLGTLDGTEWIKVNLAAYVTELRFSPDGSKLAILTNRGVMVADSANGGDLAELDLPNTTSNFEWLPDGSGLVTNDCARGVFRYELETRSEVNLRPLEVPSDFVSENYGWVPEDPEILHRHLAVSPDGNWLVTEGVWDQHLGLHVCNLQSGEWKPLSSPQRPSYVVGLQFTQEGLLAVLQAEGRLDLWDVRTRTNVGTLLQQRLLPTTFCAAFSPDGRLLAIAQDSCVQTVPWLEMLGRS